jgi:hypothetical protein
MSAMFIIQMEPAAPDNLNRARTVEEKIKDRNNAEKTASTHQYYAQALELERKLVKMNLILTLISIFLMLFEICYGLAVWNIK